LNCRQRATTTTTPGRRLTRRSVGPGSIEWGDNGRQTGCYITRIGRAAVMQVPLVLCRSRGRATEGQGGRGEDQVPEGAQCGVDVRERTGRVRGRGQWPAGRARPPIGGPFGWSPRSVRSVAQAICCTAALALVLALAVARWRAEHRALAFSAQALLGLKRRFPRARDGKNPNQSPRSIIGAASESQDMGLLAQWSPQRTAAPLWESLLAHRDVREGPLPAFCGAPSRPHGLQQSLEVTRQGQYLVDSSLQLASELAQAPSVST